MINLTLPKWLQPKDSVSKEKQVVSDDTINNNHIEPIFIKQQQPSSDNPSLTYLDDYIHQWF